jgi:maltooligosyltrehalose trehalohydrolase
MKDINAASAFFPGAHHDERGTTFVALATRAELAHVRLFDERGNTLSTIPLERKADGHFVAHLADVGVGALYKFVLDGDEVPDPYARFLPFGVHGPALVVAPHEEPALPAPPPLEHWSIYELHVGTFTPGGTFRSAIERLDQLVDLGVTAIELLPIAAFNGARGWGYDGVALYAPHAPYGSPSDLRALVRAAHERGLAALLDVVYNHFGPSGNYLGRYAPEYFTSKVKTPWGDSPSYGWLPMRRLVLDNVRYWLDEFGFDGLRLDATHEIHDASEPHLLREITRIAEPRGRRVFCEDERNEPDVVRVLGADGVWADDFHHQLHVLLTGERDGYYRAYEPTARALAETITNGWRYCGEPYAPWNGRPRGRPTDGLERQHLVTCIQNHDQVGNRALGRRLSALTSLDAFAAGAMLLLFLPTIPLLFMGQEWGASTPFLYFTDHGGELGEAVSKGRRDEFRSFAAFADERARSTIPDPEAASTFEASRLSWEERERPERQRVLEVHKTMLALRRTDPVLSSPSPSAEARVLSGDILEVVRHQGESRRTLLVNLGPIAHPFELPRGARILARSGNAADGVLPAESALLLAAD